jgi:hypothetical protein
LSPGLSFRQERDGYNLGLGTSTDFTIAPYSVNSITWAPNFTGIESIGTSNATFYSIIPRFYLQSEWITQLPDHETTARVGGSAWTSVNVQSTTPPNKTATERSNREFHDPTKTDPNPGRELGAKERTSAGGEAHVAFARKFALGTGVILDSTLLLGLGGEWNPQAVTANGLWPITDQKFGNVHGKLSLSGEFFLLDGSSNSNTLKRVSFPFFLEYQEPIPGPGLSQPRAVKAGAGVRVQTSEKTSLELDVNVDHRKDPINRTENTTVETVLTFRFF